MSQEKAEERANLWLAAGKDDLETARILNKAGKGIVYAELFYNAAKKMIRG